MSITKRLFGFALSRNKGRTKAKPRLRTLLSLFLSAYFNFLYSCVKTLKQGIFSFIIKEDLSWL